MTRVPRHDSTDQVGVVSLLMAVGLLDAILYDWTDYNYRDDDGHSSMRICKDNGGGCSAHWTNQGF